MNTTPAAATSTWLAASTAAAAAWTAFDAQADLVERLALELAAAERALTELASERDEAIDAEEQARAALDH